MTGANESAIAHGGMDCFKASSRRVHSQHFSEVTVNVAGPDARNPFTDVTLRGNFGKAGAIERRNVEGFCDSPDGSVFRIRFMPASPGDYTYSVTYQQGDFEKTSTGTFRAAEGRRRGPIRVDDLYSFRDEKGARETGTLIETWDPYKHLPTSHPVHREHQDGAADWFGFTSIQD
jgi:hypothetical protein